MRQMESRRRKEFVVCRVRTNAAHRHEVIEFDQRVMLSDASS